MMEFNEKRRNRRPVTELCLEDGGFEEGGEEAGVGYKCGPVTTGWKDT